MISTISKIFILLTASIFFIGCVDMLSYTSVDKNGNVNSSIKITISKSLLEMASAFSEDADIDYNEAFDMSEIEEVDYISSYELINTDTEYGIYLDISVPKNELAQVNIENKLSFFIPIKSGNKYYMSFQSDGFQDEDENIIVSSLKYQVFISKSYIKNIKNVVIINDQSDEHAIDFYDLHDCYLIEIPMMFLGYGQLIIN